jgi:hypothetical protein
VAELKHQAWDDLAFIRRVKAAAEHRGMTVSAALEAAGVSPYYLKKRVVGRSTNTVFNLARVLRMSPAEMFGFVAEGDERLHWDDDAAKASPPRIDGDRLRRITVVARMMAAQLAAVVYVASCPNQIDPVALMKVVLREIDGSQQSTAERGGGAEQSSPERGGSGT